MRPIVYISTCPDYSLFRLSQSLAELFSALSAAEKIRRGMRVLIKPNLIVADRVEDAAVTHPALIEALIIKVKEMGAIPVIGDSPAFGSVRGVAKAIGLDPIAKRHDVQYASFKKNADLYRFGNSSSFLAAIESKSQKRINRLSTVSRSVHDFDLILNVPKLKAHVQMGLTGATKNLYGCIAGKTKVLRHFQAHNDIELFALAILRIMERVQPEITVLDAIDTMEKQGPRHGACVRRGVLIGGTDCLAVDRVVTDLIGEDMSINYIVHFAHTYGLAASQTANITVINPNNIDLRGFEFCRDRVAISFSFPRVIKSCVRHVATFFSEK